MSTIEVQLCAIMSLKNEKDDLQSQFGLLPVFSTLSEEDWEIILFFEYR